MIKRISVRELVRNSNILEQYDFVEVEDKKSNKIRGLFISAKLANEFKEFLINKKQKDIEKKLKLLNSIQPLPKGSLNKKTIQSIKANKK